MHQILFSLFHNCEGNKQKTKKTLISTQFNSSNTSPSLNDQAVKNRYVLDEGQIGNRTPVKMQRPKTCRVSKHQWGKQVNMKIQLIYTYILLNWGMCIDGLFKLSAYIHLTWTIQLFKWALFSWDSSQVSSCMMLRLKSWKTDTQSKLSVLNKRIKSVWEVRLITSLLAVVTTFIFLVHLFQAVRRSDRRGVMSTGCQLWLTAKYSEWAASRTHWQWGLEVDECAWILGINKSVPF